VDLVKLGFARCVGGANECVDRSSGDLGCAHSALRAQLFGPKCHQRRSRANPNLGPRPLWDRWVSFWNALLDSFTRAVHQRSSVVFVFSISPPTATAGAGGLVVSGCILYRTRVPQRGIVALPTELTLHQRYRTPPPTRTCLEPAGSLARRVVPTTSRPRPWRTIRHASRDRDPHPTCP
jgi:hypothetical protein